MSRFRFVGLAALALALAGVLARTGKSAEPACVIYSLSDLGDDPDLAKWVAKTIPEVIEMGEDHDFKPAYNYYAPKKILVIRDTPEVQAKVAAFLKDLKKSLTDGREKAAAHAPERKQAVVPAEYREPAVTRAVDPAQEPGLSYPVPAPARPPKHLFHFIIRYEGEGIIDENVVKWWKIQYGPKEEKDSTTPCSPAPRACQSPSLLDSPYKRMKNAEDEEQDPGTEAATSSKKAKKEDKQ
jgi:hypothetical protein